MINSRLGNTLLISVLISICCLCALAKESRKTLLIFSADWCKYCQVAKKDMQKNKDLSEIIKNYEIIDIDYDLDKDLVKGYNVNSIPAFIVYQDGKEIKRKFGYSGPNDLTNFLK